MFDRQDRSAEPGDDADDRATPVPVTVRLSAAGHGTGVVAALIAIFLGLALVKPWSDGDGPRTPRPTPRVGAAAPTVVPTVDPLAELRHHCQEPPGWRIYSRERWASTTIRSWRSFDPAFGASGPLDPTIPLVPIVARIDAIGYCSPWVAGERPPADIQVAGWRIAVDRGAGIGSSHAEPYAETIPLQPFDPTWPSVLGALYGPPVNRFDPTAVEPIGWPAGRDVFAIRAPGYERWWAVDIEPPVAFDPGDSPTGSAQPPTP